LGGHIFYVEADSDVTKNPEAVDAIVRLGIKNDCGYISVNHFQARCPRCNFEANDKFTKECPYCHIGMDILQRITGYLVGCTDRWNSGKLAELKDRVVHDNRN
jgi:ribonucleoside-triphosphate reductase